MLRSLHIENYVLIDSLDIEFPEGLVIITGQTGAGKSILLGALSLLTGAKADASHISEGASKCIVEGEFLISEDDSEIRDMLDDAGADWEEGRLLVRRVISDTGRSRAFVNDSPVSVQLLSSLASKLVDIHSQHSSLLAADKSFQLSVLDCFAGSKALAEECAALWSRAQAEERNVASLEARLAKASEEADYNYSCARQLSEARLREGELEELEVEQKKLANVESIRESLHNALEMLSPGDEQIRSVDASLKESVRSLEHAERFIPSLNDISERLQSCRIEISDIETELNSALDGVALSDERMVEVESRMTLLYDLLRKYSCRTDSELIEVRDRFSSLVSDSSSLESGLMDERKALDTARKEHLSACAALSEARCKAAAGLAEKILESLKSLELERSLFNVELVPCVPGANGAETVVFKFSSNGTAPADLSRCASGGELSRIMLSLKAEMAHFIGMPTMIFDEIDTGVSGSAADAIGSMICSMGRDMQVFAITHLPQVAAKGDAHYLVSKTFDGGKAVSGIVRIEGDDRKCEIARMLSGATVTPEALANAEALLQNRD